MIRFEYNCFVFEFYGKDEQIIGNSIEGLNKGTNTPYVWTSINHLKNPEEEIPRSFEEMANEIINICIPDFRVTGKLRNDVNAETFQGPWVINTMPPFIGRVGDFNFDKIRLIKIK